MSVPTPTRRFEHTATANDGDVYVFGGAMYDRTYLNDMYVLTGAADAAGKVMELAYRKTLTFDYTILTEKSITIEAHVNTAELIAANRMNPSCLDVLFTLPGNGEALPFYLDPSGLRSADGVATAGCNTAHTTYWVTLPAGAVSPYQFQQTGVFCSFPLSASAFSTKTCQGTSIASTIEQQPTMPLSPVLVSLTSVRRFRLPQWICSTARRRWV
jgi:hypothetical protein